MKTGITFERDGEGLVRTGDLHLVGDVLQIRGVPDGYEGCDPDVVVACGPLTPRGNGSPYSDTPHDVEILKCTREFRSFAARWSPALVPFLPVAL